MILDVTRAWREVTQLSLINDSMTDGVRRYTTCPIVRDTVVVRSSRDGILNVTLDPAETNNINSSGKKIQTVDNGKNKKNSAER